MSTPSISKNLAGAAMVAAVIGLGVSACGSDDSVADDVSQAVDQTEEAAQSGSVQDIENAQAAVEKADEAITDRLNTIMADFEGAEDEIADDAKDAYADFRKQLADVETSVVAAIAANPDQRDAAWDDAASKAKDLQTQTSDADSKLDGELRDAVVKLGNDLGDLIKEIEQGLS